MVLGVGNCVVGVHEELRAKLQDNNQKVTTKLHACVFLYISIYIYLDKVLPSCARKTPRPHDVIQPSMLQKSPTIPLTKLPFGKLNE